MELLVSFIQWFNYFVVGYYAVTNLLYLFLLVLAMWLIIKHLHRLKYSKFQEGIHPAATQPASVLISAYNEEENILNTVKALLNLNYPNFEVIVINDGSDDATLDRLIKNYHLEEMDLIYRPIIPTEEVKGFYINPKIPNLTVVDTVHSGKSDSLNTGINVSRAPYFCSVDADSIMEKDALLSLMRPIVEYPELVKATGGIVKLVNGCTSVDGKITEVRIPREHITRFQAVEYIRSFFFGRSGWSVLNSLLIISGTFSMLHKKTVQDVGGYGVDTVTEDMELIVKMHKYLRQKKEKYLISFVPDPICWTEAPSTFKMLKKQRQRWHAGLAENIWKFKSMLFNPRYGAVGMIGMPYQFLIELGGPVIETVGYVVVIISFILGIVNVEFFVLFLFMAVLVGIFLSVASLLLEEISYRRYPRFTDLFILLIYGIFENLGYRQLTALWRCTVFFRVIFFGRKKWEHIKKEGAHIDEQTDDKIGESTVR